ncbi:hypothetical protein [Oryzobacter terrae]|uniref:hypothetical protein n=1 Tax=Oryzobacter terrae TaxID=1620385 RepID=UPI00366D6960
MNRRELRRTRAMERLSMQADVVVSAHAQARASELGYSLDDVLRCVVRPEQTYGSPARYGPDRRVYQRGTVAVVVHEGSRVVVTVLLRTIDDWVHGQDTRHGIAC